MIIKTPTLRMYSEDRLLGIMVFDDGEIIEWDSIPQLISDDMQAFINALQSNNEEEINKSLDVLLLDNEWREIKEDYEEYENYNIDINTGTFVPGSRDNDLS